jgi:hypothetical protein
VFSRNDIIREYFRLCDLVNEVEETTDLLDAEEAQAMRERYSARAEAVLDFYREERRRAERVGTRQ